MPYIRSMGGFSSITFTGREVGALVSSLAGLMMIGFEVVEIAFIDHHIGNELALAVALQAIYSLAGLAMFGLAASVGMTEYCRQHLPTRHEPVLLDNLR